MRGMVHSMFSGGVNSMGSHIGYTEVTEKYPNGSFRVFTFSNFDNGYMDHPATAVYGGTRREFAKFSSLEQTRGLLLKCEEYDSTSTLVKRKTNTFHVDTTRFVRGIYLNVLDYFRSPIVGSTHTMEYYPFLEAATYKHYTDLPRIVREDETTYSSETAQSRFRRYEYNEYGQISRMVESDSHAESVATQYRYIWEWPGYISWDFIKSPLYEVTKKVYNQNTAGENWECKRYNFHRNKIGFLGLRGYYVPISEYGISYKDASSRTDSIVYECDSVGHRIYECRNGVEPVVYLWGHQGQHIVSVVKGATLSEVITTLGCSQNDLGHLPDEHDSLMLLLRSSLPEAEVTSYKYLPLVGMVQETSPAGLRRYYEYDSNNRLKGVRDENGKLVETFQYHLAH